MFLLGCPPAEFFRTLKISGTIGIAARRTKLLLFNELGGDPVAFELIGFVEADLGPAVFLRKYQNLGCRFDAHDDVAARTWLVADVVAKKIAKPPIKLSAAMARTDLRLGLFE